MQRWCVSLLPTPERASLSGPATPFHVYLFFLSPSSFVYLVFLSTSFSPFKEIRACIHIERCGRSRAISFAILSTSAQPSSCGVTQCLEVKLFCSKTRKKKQQLQVTPLSLLHAGIARGVLRLTREHTASSSRCFFLSIKPSAFVFTTAREKEVLKSKILSRFSSLSL